MEVGARIGFILARARLTLIAFGLDLRHAPSGRNLRRYRYSYGCLVPGRPGKHQLFGCHRWPTDVRDYFGHSAERNSWSGLWPDDNRILELCLESGSGVAFGLHSVSLLRILCVPSALQRNFADALFAHQADLSRLHVHSRWRRAAVHLEWLRSACRTRWPRPRPTSLPRARRATSCGRPPPCTASRARRPAAARGVDVAQDVDAIGHDAIHAQVQ